MSLLVDISTLALDPAYANAAATRRAAGRPSPTPRRSRALLAGAGLLAATLLIVVAAVQTHRDAPAAARSRQVLLDQITRRTVIVDAMQRRLNRLRDSTESLRDSLLATTAAGSALSAKIAAQELEAGTVAASGPGLRVVVDDSAADPSGDNRVLDRDLQSIVNALWAAGAEAVAVDGQRLTTQSAIRQAGSAILVNFEPVSRPYVLSAIGDPVGLATSFGSSEAAARMRTLAQLYGLSFRYSRVASMTLPRAPGLTLRYARPVGSGAQP